MKMGSKGARSRVVPDAVFCPMKGLWWRMAEAGKKKWEIRSARSPVGRALLARKPPFPIEFRLGYSGPSLFAVGLEVRRFAHVEEVPRKILRGACLDENLDISTLVRLNLLDPVVAVRFRDIGREVSISGKGARTSGSARTPRPQS
jgi:hypothetical protein